MIPSHVSVHIFISIWTFLIYGILDNLLYESQQWWHLGWNAIFTPVVINLIHLFSLKKIKIIHMNKVFCIHTRSCKGYVRSLFSLSPWFLVVCFYNNGSQLTRLHAVYYIRLVINKPVLTQCYTLLKKRWTHFSHACVWFVFCFVFPFLPWALSHKYNGSHFRLSLFKRDSVPAEGGILYSAAPRSVTDLSLLGSNDFHVPSFRCKHTPEQLFICIQS